MTDQNLQDSGADKGSAPESAFEVIKVKPGIVYWGKDGVLPWRNWDLRSISEAEKQKLFDAGFEYLKKKD